MWESVSKAPVRTQIRCRNDRGLEACTMDLHACSDGDSIVPPWTHPNSIPRAGNVPRLGTPSWERFAAWEALGTPGKKGPSPE